MRLKILENNENDENDELLKILKIQHLHHFWRECGISRRTSWDHQRHNHFLVYMTRITSVHARAFTIIFIFGIRPHLIGPTANAVERIKIMKMIEN